MGKEANRFLGWRLLGEEILSFRVRRNRVRPFDGCPGGEKLEEFIRMAETLSDLGFSVPEVIAYDLDKGMALIEDFGDTTYSRCLMMQEPSSEDLYTLATDTLIDLHRKFEVCRKDVVIPSYSLDLYMKELNLCLEWYYPSVYSKPLSSSAIKEWEDIWMNLLTSQIKPETLVLRDFMVDNLIYLKKRQGIQQCGLLDFQDAVCGSRAYDLVSLLEDARHDVPSDIQGKMIKKYFEAFPYLDQNSFLESYFVLGAQRSTKILGVFTRMYKRYGKSKYLAHLPRVLMWLDQDLCHPSLKKVKEWFELYMPLSERKILNAD